jgi:hypothetical protein
MQALEAEVASNCQPASTRQSLQEGYQFQPRTENLAAVSDATRTLKIQIKISATSNRCPHRRSRRPSALTHFQRSSNVELEIAEFERVEIKEPAEGRLDLGL